MSKLTLQEKVIEQAKRAALKSNQMNFLLRELYKATAGKHPIFTANEVLSVNVRQAIVDEARAFAAAQAKPVPREFLETIQPAKIADVQEISGTEPISSSSDVGA